MDAVLDQHLQGLQVSGRFRQPHAFRPATEAALEIADAPDDLGLPVALVGQRHDHVGVDLGQRRTVAAVAGGADLVGVENSLVSFRVGLFHPGEERGTEVEANTGVIVDDLDNTTFVVQNAGRSIGRVAFEVDLFVPVVKGRGGVLHFHDFQPGVLTGRLIKVTVNTNIFITIVHNFLP